MSKFSNSYLIQIITQLGRQFATPDDGLQQIIQTEHHYNAWFTPQSVQQAIGAIVQSLTKENLEQLLSAYQFANHEPKKIGLILAGNIPLVGFHDVLCVLLSGNIALIKASSQDARLIKYVLKILTDIEPGLAQYFTFTDKLEGFDAIIATGSNNTSRYFEYYFGKVPNIIRKNRNSVALLTGNESKEQLHDLGKDIFEYFGLGCRSVSKLLVPTGYNFVPFFEAIEDYYPVIQHSKYHNNYDYNKAIYLVNRDKHLDNGFLLLKQDERLASPLAVIFYEEYDDLPSAQDYLSKQSENIQCIVTSASIEANNQIVNFGQSQCPALWDYADGIDTLRFLANL
ncbi:acyl-CoA reductase [Mucilaginibacter aquatilis]|uniref:long-chain-fatty-acyl-CoA reductase n=1 Tax=Mucilaginibacter aquatilis TaxID=1517760 RepID=A0A6I4IBY1_9SPHI|nr:acyl-CoA reductase [Mucilaginibacter aquatilis]MVN91066.1 acyl-CoA reductase [Mucilaginibacter aquatilis]